MIVGIDYGLKGAIAFVKAGKRKDPEPTVLDLYRGRRLARLDVTRSDVVYVEDFMGRYANKGQFDSAIRYGWLLCELDRIGCKVIRVAASKWKAALGLSKPGTSYETRKNLALALARKWWPAETFKRADEAEALLIAEYGRRLRA